jgi:tetratricopeptide (TPR) repeat protein
MKEFGLTLEQTRIMFNYQYHLVLADIEYETNFEKKQLKRRWLSKWLESTEVFLKSQVAKDSKTAASFHLVNDIDALKKLVNEIKNEVGNKLTLYLILLEVTLFSPYYLLGNSSDENFKGLKITDEEKLKNKLEVFAIHLGIDSSYVRRFKSSYKQAIEGIKGGINPWLIGVFGAVALAVVAAFATPVIAGLLAPILAPGLSGAAAVSAVLAALGGGAIAAGGFGMAGGLAVIVAGGSILGAGAGVGIGSLFAQSPDTALTQAAKLEVVMKEIVCIQKNICLAQQILKEQRQAIRSLEDKLDELHMNKERNQKEIENLKKAIEYLKKALERNQDLL